MKTDILKVERMRIFTQRSLAQQAGASPADPATAQRGVVKRAVLQIDQDRARRAYRRIAQYI